MTRAEVDLWRDAVLADLAPEAVAAALRVDASYAIAEMDRARERLAGRAASNAAAAQLRSNWGRRLRI